MNRTQSARVLPGFLAALFLTTLLPIVGAVPEIRPSSQSELLATANDYLLVNCATGTPDNSATITLTAPDLSEISVTYSTTGNCGSPANIEAFPTPPCLDNNLGGASGSRWFVIGLDGIINDTSGSIPIGSFEVTGSLIGHPVDGTWKIQSVIQFETPGDPDVCGRVGGKTFELVHGGESGLCYFNWHLAPTVLSEYSCRPDNPTPPTYGNPNDFRFFRDDSQDPSTGQTGPLAVTTNSTASCPILLFVSGAFAQAVNNTTLQPPSNIWSWFAWVDGPQTTTDLRTVLGAQELSKVNHGLAINGTSNRTTTYNNAAGTSYQFFANNSYGEAQGAVLYAPPLQCVQPDVPSTSNLEHDNNAFEVSASQAQCRGDRVDFTATMQDNPSGLQEHLTEIFIIDALTNDTVLTFNTSTMYRTGPSTIAHSHFNSTTLLPGPYVLVGIADYTGIGAVDYIDSEAFNVPSGDCFTTGDLATIINSIDDININVNTSINETVLGDLVEATGMQFGGMDTNSSWTVLLFAIVFAIGIYRGWWMIAGTGLIATIGSYFLFRGIAWPLDFAGHLLLVLLAAALESIAARWRLNTQRNDKLSG